MSFLKITIGSNQRIKDIFEGINKCESNTLVFLFNGHYPPLLEKKFLKEIKQVSQQAGKEIIFVSKKKLVRDFLKKSGLTAYSIVPAKFKEGEIISLFTLLSDQETTKIVEKTTKETTEVTTKTKEKEVKPNKNEAPVFSLQKIKKQKTPIRARIFFWFLALFLLGLALFLWQTPTAIITLRPRISTVPIMQNMILKLPNAKVDQTESTLPIIKSILLDTTVTDTEVVPTSGKDYELTPAKGKVTLFNESNKPKKLVPSRLQTSNGLVFRFQKPVTIPAKKGNKPGRYVVSVIADEFDVHQKPIGIRGNIEAGTELFFPALRSDLREVYYAKAINGPLVGGSTLVKHKLVAEDEEIAKKVLIENFKDRALQILKQQIANRKNKLGENHILLTNPDFIFTELKDFQFPTDQIGKETQTVSVTGSLTVSALIFDQNSVKKALQKFLKKSLDERRKIIDIDTKSIQYIPFDIKNFKENLWGKISVKAFATEQFSIDSTNPSFQQWILKIKQDITNKTKEEIKPILANNQEIEEVLNISIKPFWATTTPISPDRIIFKIKSVKE
ncbi:hypothetical protein CSB37_03745 [bacterium DOLZORAL124_38_8]|nr:MAG: hypothetical protein CSB37_03745 [bacterium DOLZORAL124_38_8]